ncbi:MAG: DNA replication/repair protein RecF [Marinilabiliaceae bacterium]|nr:DNA replication/repair protein RecF [Marinilabiliaceae bacterium]
MHLKHLNIINYKNIKTVELDFLEGINCFVGNNGAGKTNLLDAIYYLSFCKSCFNSTENHLINHNEDFFVIQGEYQRNDSEESIYAGFKRNQKKQFKRNKKEYSKLSEHIGLLPIVMVSPADERLIVETSEQRRKYIDSVISQFDKTYLEYLIQYNRALTQRNTLLKNWKETKGNIFSQLELWDKQLATIGSVIFDKRAKFIQEIIPVFQKYYSSISAEEEVVNIIYHSHFQNKNYISLLSENRERDLNLGYTTTGIHRDDLELLLNGYSVRSFGSQGQKKCFLIALKFAQFDFLHTQNGFAPLLLLDDIFDKLDKQRGTNLINITAQKQFKQIFITDTQKERLINAVKNTGKEFSLFEVNEGSILFN